MAGGTTELAIQSSRINTGWGGRCAGGNLSGTTCSRQRRWSLRATRRRRPPRTRSRTLCTRVENACCPLSPTACQLLF
eukprot:5176007-Pyramimonas_sp.AAC.1